MNSLLGIFIALLLSFIVTGIAIIKMMATLLRVIRFSDLEKRVKNKRSDSNWLTV